MQVLETTKLVLGILVSVAQGVWLLVLMLKRRKPDAASKIVPLKRGPL